jgi:hypothetical protein
MADFAILVLFFFFCSSLIYLVVRNKKTSLTWFQIMVFFGGKVIAGSLYGYIFKRFYNGDDTWGLNNDTVLQYKRLIHSPMAFFTDFFSNQVPPPEFYFHPSKPLERLEVSIITKLMAPVNLISNGNYYINIVFFNFLTFWGVYLLYKLLAEQFKTDNKSLAFVLYLFPPAVFWLSGLRAEGFILLFTGVLLYQFNQWLTQHRVKDAMCCLFSYFMLFILRDGFALLLIPVLTAWWLCCRFKISCYKSFGFVYLTLAIIVLLSCFVLPAQYNLLSILTKRQQEFLALHGNTRFDLTPLDGTAASFLKIFPEALMNVTIRPFFWEAKGFLQWFVTIENYFLLTLVAISIFKFPGPIRPLFQHPLLWVLICAAFSNYIIIGFTVPFPGAIVRYKIIPELFLLAIIILIIKNKRTVSL